MIFAVAASSQRDRSGRSGRLSIQFPSTVKAGWKVSGIGSKVHENGLEKWKLDGRPGRAGRRAGQRAGRRGAIQALSIHLPVIWGRPGGGSGGSGRDLVGNFHAVSRHFPWFLGRVGRVGAGLFHAVSRQFQKGSAGSAGSAAGLVGKISRQFPFTILVALGPVQGLTVALRWASCLDGNRCECREFSER